ncbi:MAG: serine hydrolase [Bacteroidota bacterium]
MKKLILIFCALFTLQLCYTQIIPDEDYIQEQMAIRHVPGLSAVVIIDDSVYWNGNFGFMNLEDSLPVHDSTLFNAFSIGKSVTTSCIMQLWDKGLLELDQNINDILPFYLINTRNDQDSITPRMLMSHTSSLKEPDYVSYFLYGDPTDELGFFVENYYTASGSYYSYQNFSNNYPGTWFHYCNHAMGLLGYLAEPILGQPFSQFAKDSLLTPLEMNKSAWFLDELDMSKLATGYEYVSGNYEPWGHLGHPAYPGMMLRTTALELANYCNMLLNQGIFDSTELLSADAVDSMSTVQNPNWAGIFGATGLGMFYRQDLGNRSVWGHNGGSGAGYAAHMYYCEQEGTGVVIMTNSEQYMPDLVTYLFDFAWLVITDISENEQRLLPNLKVYPNPANNRISLASCQKIEEIHIYNLSGQEVVKMEGVLDIDISAFIPGIYILEARTEDGVMRKKFVKR